MGLNEAVAKFIRAEAQRAYAQGYTIFAGVLTPNAKAHPSGSVGGWAEQIEAVEAEGWTLYHWAVAPSNDGKGQQAYPVFRRR